MNRVAQLIVGLALLGVGNSPLLADDADAKASKVKLSKKEKRFQEKMSGVRLRGRFTVLGKMDKPPADEEYVIKRVERVPDTEDLWAFTASMKYGANGKERSFVVPIPVKWAGDTPVISMTNFAMPGFGTFSCRVIFYNGKYSGTWKHGEVGGHMLGTYEPLDAPKPKEAKSEKKP